MQAVKSANYNLCKLPMKIFLELGKYIHQEFGIKMPESKHLMMQGRLQKRLKALQISSFKDYKNYVFSEKGKNELIHMIDTISTNKTDFFREPDHFDFLTSNILPNLIKLDKTGILNSFTIWSAGCSTGQEPYTMSIVLSEYAEKVNNFKYKILATDISTRVLEEAQNAVYSMDKIDVIPLSLKRKYFLKSKDKSKKLVKVVPSLRQKIIFERLNFMNHSFGINDKVDVIFCRNVMIYFDKKTQEELINKFAKQLRPNGYLFLGHSETINGLDVPFATIAPTIFQKNN